MRTMTLGLLLLAAGCGTREPCDASTCTGGCCDTLGRCQSGLSANACGNQGAQCRSCSATETCSSSGVCVPGSIGTGGGSTGGGSAGGNVGGGGGSGAACVSDANCGLGFMCHPVLGQCVASCTSGADCPSSAKACATIAGQAPGTGGLRGFCQCATDALCSAQTANAVCQPVTKQCSVKCPTLACPTGLTCEATTGHCLSGSPDGGAGGACVPGTCTQGLCDPVSQRCVTPPLCTMANPQPDTCTYGLICGSACAEAPFTAKGCANFTALTTPLSWDPATVTPRGPVTVAMSSIAKDVAMPLFCGSRGADFTAEVRLYAGSTNFPAMRDLLPPNFLNYVRSDGQELDVNNSVSPLVRATGGYANGLSNNNKNLTMKMNLCVTTPPPSLIAGFYGANGNPVCSTLQ